MVDNEKPEAGFFAGVLIGVVCTSLVWWGVANSGPSDNEKQIDKLIADTKVSICEMYKHHSEMQDRVILIKDAIIDVQSKTLVGALACCPTATEN